VDAHRGRLALSYRTIWIAVALAALVGALLGPASAADAAAQQGETLTGRLEIRHGDDFDHGAATEEYLLHVGDEIVELTVADDDTAHDYGGSEVTVHGRRHGDRFVVAGMDAAAAGGKPGGGGGGSTKETIPAPVTGPRDTLVIMMRLSGDQTTAMRDPAEVRNAVFLGPDSTATYYAETSGGAISLRGKLDGTAADPDAAIGDVTRVYNVAGSTSRCDFVTWGQNARNAAAADWDLTGYEHIVHIFPKVAACEWAGMGMVGGQHSWINGTFIEASFLTTVVAHELGHNLKLQHAQSWECTASGRRVSLGGTCTTTEYGDSFDVMGRSYHGYQFNSRAKNYLGWMDRSKTTAVPGTGTFVLHPAAGPAAGSQVLQIPRSTSSYFYVEYRRPSGVTDDFAPTDDVVSGVLIRTGGSLWSTTERSVLIDTAPFTASFVKNENLTDGFLDAALNQGERFVDPVSGIAIETLSINSDGTATVTVSRNQANSAPTASTDDPAPMLAGAPYTVFGASASDATRNLSDYRWTWASCPGTCPEMSGDTGQLSGGSDTVAGPTFTPANGGTYRLLLTVYDTLGASGTSTITLTAAGLLP
jgi:hypothetical protein